MRTLSVAGAAFLLIVACLVAVRAAPNLPVASPSPVSGSAAPHPLRELRLIGHAPTPMSERQYAAGPTVTPLGNGEYSIVIPVAPARIETPLTSFIALYIFMLAAFTGYEIIRRVPAILHTPLMSGSNFVHGIVVVGALYALLNARTPVEQAIGFVGVLLGAANAGGGYVVTERMLEMFKASGPKT